MSPNILTEPCEFWMVWTKTGKMPKCIHNTSADAIAEAERLSRKTPGRKFIVLRAFTKMHAPHANEAVTPDAPIEQEIVAEVMA